MVADVTETRNVIPSLEFKTCMTIKSKPGIFVKKCFRRDQYETYLTMQI